MRPPKPSATVPAPPLVGHSAYRRLEAAEAERPPHYRPKALAADAENPDTWPTATRCLPREEGGHPRPTSSPSPREPDELAKRIARTSKDPAMMIRVARIEAHSTPRTTRAEVQGSLFGAAPVARVIWELPGPRETWWLVQVPEELATDQLRRFAHLRISADVVGFRSVEMLDGNGSRGCGVESGFRRFPFRPVC